MQTGYYTFELVADNGFPDEGAAKAAVEKEAGFSFKDKKPEESGDKTHGLNVLSYKTAPEKNLTLDLAYKAGKLIKVAEHVTELGEE